MVGRRKWTSGVDKGRGGVPAVRRHSEARKLQAHFIVEHYIQNLRGSQNRIEEGVDLLLHETQFGFRKQRGTSDAVHCIRRIREYEEQHYGSCIMVRLDGEKAFDKIKHDEMWETMEEIGVPERMVANLKICTRAQSSE